MKGNIHTLSKTIEAAVFAVAAMMSLLASDDPVDPRVPEQPREGIYIYRSVSEAFFQAVGVYDPHDRPARQLLDMDLVKNRGKRAKSRRRAKRRAFLV